MKNARLLLLLLLLSSCGTFEKNLQHDRTDGVYRFREAKSAAGKYFVTFSEDTIALYPVGAGRRPGATPARILVVPENRPGDGPYHFAKTSVDLDLTTVLFKFRPAAGDLPPQMNTQFNFAVYSGYRRDYYKLTFRKDPLQRPQQEFRHWGFDCGALLGIGAVPMNPWVTRQAVEAEYDGLILQGGLAAFASLGSFSAGLCLGIDHLTDQNRKHWIYHNKPWVGLAIGLALN